MSEFQMLAVWVGVATLCLAGIVAGLIMLIRTSTGAATSPMARREGPISPSSES